MSYTPQGLLHDADAAQTMAQAEGLWAHALSVGLRRQLAERGADVFGEDRPDAAAAGGIAWPITLDAPKPAPGDQEA